ncbi:hypothetical protein L3X38_025029 [Prunus dulcis]|uniref:CCHC-type domain-containing protein n=1 Tax=Prunus dulcis TaxID=3755 RepID=A0AAD4Z6Z0_PRUDU|nr:hypothetical protein L3X38_025029 [Prunus dulcis]
MEFSVLQERATSAMFTEVAYKRLKAECGRLNTLVETWKEQHEQTSLNLGCHNNVVRDPIVAKTKGKQTTGSKGKKAPQCRECKVTGHNKRNCPNRIVGEGGKQKRDYRSDRSDILSSFGPKDDTTIGNKTFYSSSSAVHRTKTLSSSYTTPNSGFSCGEVSSGSTHYTSDGFTFETLEYSVLESQFDTQASPPRDPPHLQTSITTDADHPNPRDRTQNVRPDLAVTPRDFAAPSDLPGPEYLENRPVFPRMSRLSFSVVRPPLLAIKAFPGVLQLCKLLHVYFSNSQSFKLFSELSFYVLEIFKDFESLTAMAALTEN